MAQLVGSQIKLNNGQLITPQEGGWYDAQRYLSGKLLNPGEHQPGQLVSNEVIAQTNPANVAYVQQQRQQMQPTAPTVQTGQTGMPDTSGAGVGTGVGMTPAPTIDLPALYKNLYASSGISGLEADLSSKTTAYNDALSKINDNPFLSEATRVGRVQKLSTDFNNSVANLKNDVATKKADIETQLNLQTKQFDINSAQAKQALDQFNTLLSSGALSGASGEDIANITRSTGISSSMIQSAVNAQKVKDVKTTIHEYDDGTNQGFVAIDNNGNIVNKQVIAASKPKTTGTGTGNDMTASEAKSSAAQIINSYLYNKTQQAQISPEDLYRTLLDKFNKYKDVVDYITTNWTPEKIRKQWK